MILRGLIIGVVISAPMGPVGIYCLQRTLDKGRLSGFYTGIGAAISDFIYCLLTGFGLSFIEDFINNHRDPIQLLGSIVLIFFGIWLMRKKPDGGGIAADADHGAPSREGDILKGFALTFSNPLILFLIIGLFAQFNFVIEGMKFYHYLLGFVGIVGGALGWWWLVTHFVEKLRGHFNQRTMKLINMVIGVIILIFAAVGIFSSASSMLAAPPVRPSPVERQETLRSVEFRVADTSMKGWKAELAGERGEAVVIEVSPRSQSEPFGDTKVDALSVRVTEMPSGLLLGEALISDGVDPYRGKNAWRVVRVGDRWNLFAGNREYRHVLDFTTAVRPSGVPRMMSKDSKGALEAYVCDIKSVPVDDVQSTEADLFSALERCGAGAMDVAGIYSVLDYEHDDAYARLGGSYRLAVLPQGDSGVYALHYLGGVRLNASMWTPGRVKGRLLPTAFPTVFDVEWCDAEGEWMLYDVQAEFDRLARTLTVKFPYQGSSIRLRKE
ncbi:MAG: LysE family translocator [Muribaculaceae bacterium]|nr:LysE family translocator [Muribaculaceae bacterium]